MWMQLYTNNRHALMDIHFSSSRQIASFVFFYNLPTLLLCFVLSLYNYSLPWLFSSHQMYNRAYRQTIYNTLIENNTDKCGNSREMGCHQVVYSAPNSTKNKDVTFSKNRTEQRMRPELKWRLKK